LPANSWGEVPEVPKRSPIVKLPRMAIAVPVLFNSSTPALTVVKPV